MFKKLVLASTAVIGLAGPAMAQTAPFPDVRMCAECRQSLGPALTINPNDIRDMVDAAYYNKPRYERYYRGQTFIGVGNFVGINLSSRNIGVAFPEGRLDSRSSPTIVYCSDHGLNSDLVANWIPRVTRLRIEGAIVDASSSGNVDLKNCKITAG
jgi:hypothetical protein